MQFMILQGRKGSSPTCCWWAIPGYPETGILFLTFCFCWTGVVQLWTAPSPSLTTKAYRELRITSWLCLVHFAVIADRTIPLLHPGLHSSNLVKLFLRKVFSSHPSWEQTVKADNGKFSIFGISHLMLLWKVDLENITE